MIRAVVEQVVGFVCGRCGLSDAGFTRLASFGFDPHPCNRCRGHFAEGSS